MNKIIEAHKFFLKKAKVICKDIQIGTITHDYQNRILNINKNPFSIHLKRMCIGYDDNYTTNITTKHLRDD